MVEEQRISPFCVTASTHTYYRNVTASHKKNNGFMNFLKIISKSDPRTQTNQDALKFEV